MSFDYRAEQEFPYVTVYDADGELVGAHYPYHVAFAHYGDESWPEPITMTREKVTMHTLEQQLRDLTRKWISQAHHPMRRNKPEERDVLLKCATDVQSVLATWRDQ